MPVLDFDPAIGETLRNPDASAESLWPVFARLSEVRMLVVRGALFDILAASTVERMRHEKPDLESVTVENRAHVPLLDEPVALAAINQFLASLRCPQSGP